MSAPPDSLVHTRPWVDIEPSAALLAVPTMLSTRELGLLYWLGRDYWSGAGRIIDAGCFLGGSTVAFASGVRDSSREHATPPIVVYDQFRVEQYSVDGGFFKDAPDLAVDDDFSPLFERNVQRVRGLLDVRPGDILQQRWDGTPIEILFLDVLKTWAINDYVVREFWPTLIPERAIVVHQDYQYGGYPWLAITMELLHDYFERLDDMPWATVVFRLLGPLPDLRMMTLSRDLPLADKLVLMDRALDRETQAGGEAMLRLSRALLLKYLGRPRAANAEVSAVMLQHGGDASVRAAAQTVLSTMSGEGEGTHHDPLTRAMNSLAL
jgi:hypothetical protein